RAYSVSGMPLSASTSARPPPIWPSPTIPTRLVNRDLAPEDPRDQVDQLPERLHRVAAPEARQLPGVDRHLVLSLKLLEQGEKEERIEAEIVEQMRLVPHLADVAFQLVGKEALHLCADLRALDGARRPAELRRGALVRHESSCVTTGAASRSA